MLLAGEERFHIIVLLLHLCVCSSFLDLTLARNYTGSQVIRLWTEDENFIQTMYAQGLDVWSANTTCLDVCIEKEEVQKFKKILKKNNINFKTIIHDLQRIIDNENLPSTRLGTSTKPVKGMNWEQYHSLRTIYDYMDGLAERFKDIASVGVMGHTAEGRPLKYIRISSGLSEAKAVFIDGGIHAREWISPASVSFVVNQLVENRTQLPEELKKMDFYVLPVLNPDGYAYSQESERLWRKNRWEGLKCSGVDLNRNFDFRWGGEGSSSNECSDVFRGRQAASEPETRAVQNFIWQIRTRLKAYITFHSYGQYILTPYGFGRNHLPDDNDELMKVAKAASIEIFKKTGASYKVGNSALMLYPASGGSEDWVKGRASVKHAYCIELRDTGEFGFVLPSTSIIPTALDAFQAVKVISTMAVEP